VDDASDWLHASILNRRAPKIKKRAVNRCGYNRHKKRGFGPAPGKRKPQPGRTGWGPEVSAVWSQPIQFNLRSTMLAVIVLICRSGPKPRHDSGEAAGESGISGHVGARQQIDLRARWSP
jgi:hypothetical protein